MATDPRAALDRLVAALEAHLAAAQRRQGDEDPAVEAAYTALADAFEVYEESLYTAYEEVTPFELFDEDEDGLDEDDEDDDDEDDDLDDDAPGGADDDLAGGSGPGPDGRPSRR